MSITLEGIAKDYYVDRSVEVLQIHGFEQILVEADGNLAPRGSRVN
jgi:thiamine biosynthesis lipoprotein